MGGDGRGRPAALVDGIALRRLGTPDDIAHAVLFFASEPAGWITGQTLSVDGGKELPVTRRGLLERRGRPRTWPSWSSFCRIPSVSTDPAYAPDMRRGRRLGRGPADAAPGSSVSRSPRPAAIRPSLAEWLQRRGRAHGPGLRPLRRAAARPAGRLAEPALRADGARRPPLRARRLRRQGAGADPDPGRRGVPADRGPAAGQPQVPDRGRGGGRAARISAPSSPPTRSASPPTPSSRPTAPCGASTCRSSPWRAGASARSR